MKKTIILSFAFFICGIALAGKIVPLPDILKPIGIQIDNSQIYITEGTSIYIYSLDDFKLVKKFGKEGEGPQEFKILPQLPLIINVSTNRIMVNSLGKVSYFTKNGEFINEKKVKAGFVFALLPLGKYLAGQGLTQENNIRYRSINIYDRELNKIKEVCKVEDNFQGPGQGFKVVHTAFAHQTMGDLLYVAQSKDFIINVFDQKGKELSSITMDYELVNMTQKDRDDIKNYIETDANIKQFSEFLKPIRYPDEFPAIFTMFSTEQKLYVMTWKRVNQQNEFFVFDKKGNLIKKSFLPLAYQNAILPSPFAIKNNKFYQLVENEENEEWELHIHEIK